MTNINGVLPQADPDQDDQLAPITGMILVAADRARQFAQAGGLLRHKRLAGLSSVEFGLVASPGRRPPMSVVRLAEAGIRKLLSRAVNRRDNREVLVCLTRTGLIAHDAMVAGARKRNQRLLEQLGKADEAVLLGHVDRLTDMAAKMLDAEKDLN